MFYLHYFVINVSQRQKTNLDKRAFSSFVSNIRDPQQLCNVRVAERDVLEAGELEWLLVDERTFLTYDY